MLDNVQSEAPQQAPVSPQAGAGGRADAGNMSPSFVHAIGRGEARFSSLGVEKEFAQVAGRSDTAGLTDQQALRELLLDRANRYLARAISWVFTIEGLETYLLIPRDPIDFELLLEAIRPNPRPTDVDVVIGSRGPLAPPDFANGLILPIIAFDQLYSFDIDSLIDAIPRPDDVSAEDFRPVAEDVFNRVIQIADNAGATDEHRALNYLAVRYPTIYSEAARQLTTDSALAGVRVRPSRLSGVRRIVDVIFSFRSRQTDVADSFFVRVDVTEEFPFLVTKLSPYYERA